jgi:hypothetical protein
MSSKQIVRRDAKASIGKILPKHENGDVLRYDFVIP